TPSRNERRQAAIHRRRQEAAHRTAAARRSARRRRRLKALAGVVAVAVVVTGVVFLLRNDGDGDGPSADLQAQKVSGATGPLALSALPTSYRAVYRAEVYEGSTPTVSTEEVSIQRPFDGRVAILEGEPPGGASRFEGRSTFGVYANYTDGGAVQAAADAPTVALGDIRLADSLDELRRQGLFVLGDRRRAKVGGETRECQTYRTGSPLQSLKITAPSATDYVDVCLDSTGLILEEVVIAGGTPSQRLIATSFEAEPTLDPALFRIDAEKVGPAQGGAIVTEVDRATAPAPGYWAPAATPAGFTHQGRYKVEGTNTSWVDVYVRGIDLLTIRQGAPAAEPDLSEAGAGTDVDLGSLGAGKLLLRTLGPTAIGHPGAEAFVHVTATISPADVQALASALRKG
ncbi:MAG TPA: hypothetical protein VF244_06730, partial [Acidimicrobiales bacterium]